MSYFIENWIVIILIILISLILLSIRYSIRSIFLFLFGKKIKIYFRKKQSNHSVCSIYFLDKYKKLDLDLNENIVSKEFKKLLQELYKDEKIKNFLAYKEKSKKHKKEIKKFCLLIKNIIDSSGESIQPVNIYLPRNSISELIFIIEDDQYQQIIKKRINTAFDNTLILEQDKKWSLL